MFLQSGRTLINVMETVLSAKTAQSVCMSYDLIPHTGFKFYINKYICDLSPNEAYENKLHSIKPVIGNAGTVYRLVPREED